MTTKITLSQRAQRLTSSAIREILKVTERPEVIRSPAACLRRLPSRSTASAGRAPRYWPNPRSFVQYGPTEGYRPCAMDRPAPEQERRGHRSRPGAGHYRFTAGPGPISKVLIDVDSKVLVETPSYLGALQAFSLFQPAYCSVPSDNAGIVTEAFTAELGRRPFPVLPAQFSESLRSALAAGTSQGAA